MSRFISGRGNSTQRYANGGRTTSFPRRQGYIDDRLGSGYEDDVPAMLTAGEFVIRRSSVQKYGETFLNRLNQGLVSDDVRYMNQGGRVNNGRNDMPHMSRTRQQRRRRSGTRRRVMNGEMGGNPIYSSRRTRRSSRRTAAPRRSTGMMRPTRSTRRRVARPARRTSSYNTGGRVQGRRVQNFYHGGMAHSNGNGAMMTSTMNGPNNGTVYSGTNNGRGTMNNYLKYKGKYYDCHGSLYFTPECSEVANKQLVDHKTGKIDTPKF